jgi:hypothetical protein
MKAKLSNITIVLTIISILLLTGCSRSRAPEDKPVTGDELTTLKREYCFKSDLGIMVHFATQPERTSEGVLYEFDASGLIAAGLDPSRMKQLPELGRMTPGLWYFLPKGQLDPHHAHAMPGPTIAIAVNVK